MKSLLLAFIRWYQKASFLSLRPLLLIEGSCKFQPTCSEYSYQAIDRYGTIQGLFLSLKRIIHCHPFSKGGVDPIPTKVVRH